MKQKHLPDHYAIWTLREVTETSLKSLKDNRLIRETLGGSNHHYEQCAGVPDTLDKPYFLHAKCFKKFAYAKTLSKRKGNDDNSVSKVPRLTRSIGRDDNSCSTTSSMFPDSCMICKKKKIKVNGKEQHPKKIVTFEAEKTLKSCRIKT